MNGSNESHDALHAAYQECVELFNASDYEAAETKLNSTLEFGKTVLQHDIRSQKIEESRVTRSLLGRVYVYKARLLCRKSEVVNALSEFEEALKMTAFNDPDIVSEVFVRFLPAFSNWMSEVAGQKSQELIEAFRKQEDNRNSSEFYRSFYGHTVAITVAEVLRENGTRGYDNDLLKGLYLSRAVKLIGREPDIFFPFSPHLPAEDCSKAIEYANGRDFEAFKVAAIVFNQMGDPYKARDYCREALKRTKELELLLLEIEADIRDGGVTPEVQPATPQKQQPDETWLTDTCADTHKQQRQRLAKQNLPKQKKRKSSRSENKQRNSLSLSTAAPGGCGGTSQRSSVSSICSTDVAESGGVAAAGRVDRGGRGGELCYQRDSRATSAGELPDHRRDDMKNAVEVAVTTETSSRASSPSTSVPPSYQKKQVTAEPSRAKENQLQQAILDNDDFDLQNGTSSKKRKAKVISKRMFDKILQSYELKLACETCFHETGDNSSCGYVIKEHLCEKTKLLLRSRSGSTSWQPIRNVPLDQNDVVEVCEGGMISKCEKGAKCKFAHSETERFVWDLCISLNWNMKAFMNDLNSTNLLLRAVLSNVPENVEIYLGCKECITNKEYISCRKLNSQTPTCGENHQWATLTADAMVKIAESSDETEAFIHPLVSQMPVPDNSPEELAEILHEAWELLQGNFRAHEIVSELDIVRKQMEEIPVKVKKIDRLRYSHKTNQRCERISTSAVGSQDLDHGNPIFDTEFDDILTNKDVDEGQNKIIADLGDFETYYINKPREELAGLLQNDKDKYRICRISLVGTMEATCYILDTVDPLEPSDITPEGKSQDSNEGLDEIEICGRQNCGMAFDGDEVVVEIINVEKLDQFLVRDDQEKFVRRGRVIGVWKECSNREAYNYVCTVDTYLSHLMMPICGIAPKIYCKRREIKDLNEKVRNRLVCIYEKKGAKIKYVRRVAISPKERHNQLFVVKYEKWGLDQVYPYGYVAKVIKPGKDVLSGQRVIDLMYQVPGKYDKRLVRNAEARFGTTIPKAMKEQQKSLVDVNMISINPPGCQDVEFALSVSTIDEGGSQLYELGIHIADVSAFVEKNDEIDEEIMKRRISFHPADRESGEINHMLPSILSTNICSLLENKERLALSVSIKLNSDGTMHSKPQFMRSVVVNKRQLSYAEAQKLIDDANNDEDSTTEMVQILHNLAQACRRIRLGYGAYHKEVRSITEQEDNASEAHNLVEEFMILANVCAAEFLVERYGKGVPLRRESPPLPQKEKKWMDDHGSTAFGSFFFGHYIPDETLDHDNVGAFYILSTTHKNLDMGLQRKSKDMIVSAVAEENIHPSFTVARDSWIDIQYPPEVVVLDHEEHCKHFALNQDLYTWFTSPIRRSVDIVVHRMIVAAIGTGKMCQNPYTQNDLKSLCVKFNITYRRQRKHNRACDQLKTAQFLHESPLYLPSVVTSFDDSNLQFQLPFLHNIKKSVRRLPLNLFGVCDKPRFFDNDEVLTVMCQKRMYDANAQKPIHARSLQDAKEEEYVATDQSLHTSHISSSLWCDLIQAIAEDQTDVALFALTGQLLHDSNLHSVKSVHHEDYAKSHVSVICQGARKTKYFKDLTSEMQSGLKIVKHHVKFSTSFYQGLVSQLQLGCIYKKGLIEPQINLVSLTPTLDLCIEHSRDPVACFAEVAVTSHKRDYNSVHDYKETWLPMMAMEAACSAVSEGDPVIINNVPVDLKKTSHTFSGTFELALSFCEHRQIHLFTNNKDQSESQMNEEDEAQDYFCLRVPTQSSALALPYSNLAVKNHIKWKNKWTAHCIINPKKSYLTHEKMVKVHFNINQWSSEPPEVLINPVEGSTVPATIEFLAKPLLHRRMELAVNKLGDATDFCRKIVLGETFTQDEAAYTPGVAPYEVPQDLNIDVKCEKSAQSERKRFVPPEKAQLPGNTACQNDAIRTALTQKFTLIQGPPGTGKTLTGAKLVYWFNEMNKQNFMGKSKKHVMYCGPSNGAVDEAAKTLRVRLREKCPKIVRVYSEMLENQMFPLPRDATVNAMSRRYEMGGNADIDEISLHHLIRKEPNPFHNQILEKDRRFNEAPPEDIDDEEVKAYQKLITDAAVHELMQHEVILCTCSESASQRIVRGTNVIQCIINESGMCMEPETLIPLVSHKPEQIVLIGDHKQLRPIVSNATAKQLGLEISMFERQTNLCGHKYGKFFKVIKLRKQYRIIWYINSSENVYLCVQVTLNSLYYESYSDLKHPEICKFPSQHFYENQLITIPTRYWTGVPMTIWPTTNQPFVFCHTEGEERTSAVLMEEGNEQSKSNQKEIDNAIRIYMEFVHELKVSQRNIVILSQYKAQCEQIEKDMKDRGMAEPNVRTVVASQGYEWDYVILTTVRSIPRYEIEERPSEEWLKKNLGFINDHHQINVAITRARRGLVIIGNKHLLKCDGGENGLWGKLLQYYKDHYAVIDVETFPRCAEEFKNRERLFTNYPTKNTSHFSKDKNKQEQKRQLAPRYEKNLSRKY